MSKSIRRRIAGAAVLATAALCSAVPAQAAAAPTAERCQDRLEQIETRFRVIEEKRGYEAATEWWYDRWERFHNRCGDYI